MAPARKEPFYYVHENGFKMPKGFPPENFEPALKYQPDNDDIFIVTYPKCGTTWCQYILYLMLHEGEPLPKGQRIDKYYPHLEEVGSDTIAAINSRPRIIKTHLPFELNPYNPKSKYIYVARNPKDCCVSFYHHTRGFPIHYDFADGTFDEYFELYLNGEVDFGDYFDHLLSWVAHKNDSNVLFILYEDMKMNIREMVKSIGKFLGGRFLDAVQDDSIVQKIIEHSSLSSMKKNPDSWSSRRPEGMPEFIRKGAIGDWRNYFSEDQTKRLDEKFALRTKGTAAHDLWIKYDC